MSAANDTLVGAAVSRSAQEGREAIGARGPGILNAVRLDPGGDWSAAGLLKPGDRVQSGRAPIARAPVGKGVNQQRQENAAHLEVVSVAPVEGGAIKVYNFEVADHHTYAVGELEAWAHNAGLQDYIDWGKEFLRRNPCAKAPEFRCEIKRKFPDISKLDLKKTEKYCRIRKSSATK